MNHHRIASGRLARRQRSQSPLERINLFLERNREGCSIEMIQRLRRALFGDLVDEIESSADNLPK